MENNNKPTAIYQRDRAYLKEVIKPKLIKKRGSIEAYYKWVLHNIKCYSFGVRQLLEVQNAGLPINQEQLNSFKEFIVHLTEEARELEGGEA
tara:strand:+ start:3978 stop:4253 length:276 start_codon:yes stop_codon:yes gene_type:complete